MDNIKHQPEHETAITCYVKILKFTVGTLQAQINNDDARSAAFNGGMTMQTLVNGYCYDELNPCSQCFVQ
jgi:hypothetical protein